MDGQWETEEVGCSSAQLCLFQLLREAALREVPAIRAQCCLRLHEHEHEHEQRIHHGQVTWFSALNTGKLMSLDSMSLDYHHCSGSMWEPLLTSSRGRRQKAGDKFHPSWPQVPNILQLGPTPNFLAMFQQYHHILWFHRGINPLIQTEHLGSPKSIIWQQRPLCMWACKEIFHI